MTSKAYDYIVVGAGAAGSIVAARLGEDRSVRVLVLEAGPSDNSIYVRMPAAMSYPLTASAGPGVSRRDRRPRSAGA